MSPERISSGLSLSEQRWLEHISQNFVIDIDIHPCVFGVPESLKQTKPEAYAPKKLGLGPYLHFRKEFHPMESQKRAAAKSFLNPHQFLNFKDLVVNKLVDLESLIRACYDRYVDLEGKSLAWILAIDSIYLLYFVRTYLDRKDKGLATDSSTEELARDVLVLENQIPVRILEEILMALETTAAYDQSVATHCSLLDYFYRFCNEQSPLRLADREVLKNDLGPKHLLNYTYQLILNHRGGEDMLVDSQPQVSRVDDAGSDFTTLAEFAMTEGQEIVQEAVAEVSAAFDSAKAAGIKVPGNLQVASRILHTVQKSLTILDRNERNFESNYLAHEIDVPSVAQLSGIAKMKFKLTSGGIRDIRLEADDTLYLPVITLRANSEVILRNLLAYEAASAEPGSSLELADYLDLMCGIVDTPQDINLLKKAGIIKGDITDREMLEIFNGFKKSTGNSNEKSSLEKIADQVRKQFQHVGIVRTSMRIRKYLDASKKILNRVISIMLFLVLAFQLYREFHGVFSKEPAGGIFGASYLGLPAQAPTVHGQVYSYEIKPSKSMGNGAFFL